jgi:arginyl-tRNA synthetase
VTRGDVNNNNNNNNNSNNNNINNNVYEEGDVTVLWNQAVHKDRKVTANRPVIIIKNKKEKIYIIVDVAIHVDRNVMQKEAEKKLKYKSLCTEKQ